MPFFFFFNPVCFDSIRLVQSFRLSIIQRRVSGKQMAVNMRFAIVQGTEILVLVQSMSDEMGTRIRCMIVPE